MTVTPRNGSTGSNPLQTLAASSGGSLTASGGDSLDVARRRRVELLDTIHAFERALAVPSADPDWRRRVAQRLAGLRQAFAEHIAVTEGESGLYAELLTAAPRLARAVGVLSREHSMVARTLDALSQRVRDSDVEVEQLRNWASDLLRALSRHRQRGADLVYEAYATDIGGET